MKINIYGDALKLLEDFIYYATGKYASNLASAMWYNEDGFRERVWHLEKAVREAMIEENKRQGCYY